MFIFFCKHISWLADVVVQLVHHISFFFWDAGPSAGDRQTDHKRGIMARTKSQAVAAKPSAKGKAKAVAKPSPKVKTAAKSKAAAARSTDLSPCSVPKKRARKMTDDNPFERSPPPNQQTVTSFFQSQQQASSQASQPQSSGVNPKSSSSPEPVESSVPATSVEHTQATAPETMPSTSRPSASSTGELPSPAAQRIDQDELLAIKKHERFRAFLWDMENNEAYFPFEDPATYHFDKTKFNEWFSGHPDQTTRTVRYVYRGNKPRIFW